MSTITDSWLRKQFRTKKMSMHWVWIHFRFSLQIQNTSWAQHFLGTNYDPTLKGSSRNIIWTELWQRTTYLYILGGLTFFWLQSCLCICIMHLHFFLNASGVSVMARNSGEPSFRDRFTKAWRVSSQAKNYSEKGQNDFFSKTSLSMFIVCSKVDSDLFAANLPGPSKKNSENKTLTID